MTLVCGNYARLNKFKSDMNVNFATTTYDDDYLSAIESASRGVDRETERHFYVIQNDVRYFHGGVGVTGRRLWVDDLPVVPSLVQIDADWDGSYGTTLVNNVDYRLIRDEHLTGSPWVRLDLLQGSSLSAWPRHDQAVKITGSFGFSFDTLSVTTITEPIILTTAITLTVAATEDIQKGDVLVIDSEQLLVTAIDALVVTVSRGVNGSTAATHIDNSVILRHTYPARIAEAVSLEATRLRWEMQSGYQGTIAATEAGEAGVSISRFRQLYPAIRNRVEDYKRVSVV